MLQFTKLNIKGNTNPWCNTIDRYLSNSDLVATRTTLGELKHRILQENPPFSRVKMINLAFTRLLDKTGLKNMQPDEELMIPKTTIHLSPVLMSMIPEPLRAHKVQVIADHLKKFIAGQDEAVASLSFLAHRYLCNKILVDAGKLPASRPAHCILTGPTGCGKSECLKRLGQFLDVPILHINARSLTDEGFKGTNFSQVVGRFCKSNRNSKLAIVAVDEIDKLASREDDGTKNFGLAIQRVLLSCLDGNPVSEDKISYDVSNWWFVGTGAFSGLKGLHDGKDERSTTARTHADVIMAGFEPEFAGRFQSIIPFSDHTVVTMMDVITREGSPLNQVQNEFRQFYNVTLNFENQALQRLAEASIKISLGVRSLHTILNFALQPFYVKADDLVGGELTVGLDDLLPALEKFKRDDKKIERNPPPYGMYI